MTGFRIALLISLVLHIGVIITLSISTEIKADTTTRYYVDLVSMGGPPGGSSVRTVKKSSPPKKQAEEKVKKSDPVPDEPDNTPKSSLRDLTTKPEAPKSKLRFPDKKNKRRSVKRKKPRESVTVVRKKKKKKGSGRETVVKKNLPSNALSTSINSVGGGKGTGSGFGTGGGKYFPYAYYVETLRNKISSTWYSPGAGSKLEAVVKFRIFRDGRISDLSLEVSSGSDAFDRSAMRAVKNAAPFPRLPSDFTSSYLAVHLKFE